MFCLFLFKQAFPLHCPYYNPAFFSVTRTKLTRCLGANILVGLLETRKPKNYKHPKKYSVGSVRWKGLIILITCHHVAEGWQNS